MLSRKPKGDGMKYFACAAILAAALLAFACDDDGGPDANETSSAETPQAQTTADPLPTVTGNTVVSPAKGYSITFPADWQTRFNLVTSPTQRADSYFAPESAGLTINTNITVVCETTADGAAPADFIERRIATITQLTGGSPQLSDVTVASRQGQRADYTQTSTAANLELAKSDVYVLGDDCGYTITLTADPSKRDEYQDEFQAMVDSFTILP
jgi:hypothetical protein